MKIKSVALQNVRNIEDLTFTPGKINIFAGKNGAGKTTVERAIPYALHGKGLNDSDVKYGRSMMEVYMKLENAATGDDFEISRIRTPGATAKSSVLVNGKKTTGKNLATTIEEASGSAVSLEALEVVTSSELLENITPDKFASFIRTYAPQLMDIHEVKATYPLFSPECMAEIDMSLPNTGKFDLDTITDAYDRWFAERKIAKKEQSIRAARVASFTCEPPVETMEDIDKALERIAVEEGKASAMKEAIATYEAAEANQKSLFAEIKKIESEIAAILTEAPTKMEKEMLEKEMTANTKRSNDIRKLIGVLEQNVQLLDVNIKNLDTCVCPLSECLVCTVDKKPIIGEMTEQMKEKKEEIEEYSKELKDLEAERAVLLIKEKDIQARDVEMAKKAAKTAALNKMKSTIKPLPPKPAIITTTIVDYEEEKKELNEKKRVINAYDKFLKDSDELKHFTERVEILDSLIEVFKPKGVFFETVTSEYIQDLEDTCNERAAELRPGFSIRLVSDEGIRIECETTPGRGYLPYEKLSAGEREYVTFIILDMLNQLTGLNIMLLDDLDKLDAAAFKSLLSLINTPTVLDAYDHIFIAMVNHEDTMAAIHDLGLDSSIISLT